MNLMVQVVVQHYNVAYIIVIDEIDNNCNDLLPYWYFNYTKLYTGCTILDA